MLASRRVAARIPSLFRTVKDVNVRATYTTYSQLPEEHRMIYEMCAKFADEELIPHAGEWDKKHEYPVHAIAQLVRAYLEM
jgi:alkylation response protein AidB-like acyl-CoA dehydrogenase